MNLNAVADELSLRLNKLALEKISEEPTTPVLVLENLSEREVIAWLEAKHCQLWEGHNIATYEGKRKAANWFIESIYDFYKFKATHN